jgi:hypothetical protein
MNYLKKYQTETKRIPYCWNEKGEYVRSGSYSDDYVKWLERQLQQSELNLCNCKIPEPTGKCSENGIISYCKKCLKNYSN